MKTLADTHARAQWFTPRGSHTVTGRYHGMQIRIERHGSCWSEHRLSIQHEDGSSYETFQACASVASLKQLAKDRINEGMRRGWITCLCQQPGNA